MESKAQKALEAAKDLAVMVRSMLPEAHDLDLERLLKQVEADLMDTQHKLSVAIKLMKRS